MGTEASAPFVVTLVVYFGAHLARRNFAGRPSFDAPARTRMKIDLYLLAIFGIVMYLHFHLKMWVPLVNDHNFDEAFYAINERFRSVLDGMRATLALLA